MKIGVLLLMVVFLAVLVGLLVLSFKMLKNVRQEEIAAKKGQAPERQLHPKLKAELEQRKKDQEK